MLYFVAKNYVVLRAPVEGTLLRVSLDVCSSRQVAFLLTCKLIPWVLGIKIGWRIGTLASTLVCLTIKHLEPPLPPTSKVLTHTKGVSDEDGQIESIKPTLEIISMKCCLKFGARTAYFGHPWHELMMNTGYKQHDSLSLSQRL
jgi:hypothetical protein